MATPIPPNHARFTMRELAAATGGTLAGQDGDAHIVGVVTDSRAVVEGNAFIALRGETQDGHDYLARAVEQGARAVVIESGRPRPQGVAVLHVNDTRAAFGRVAHTHLQRCRRRPLASPMRVAAITGSAGKTTTKDLAATILRAIGTCHATPGNLNNLIGVPAVALAASDEAFAVFELGMSEPGEIAALSKIVEADVAALLNVGVAHASSFGGLRAAVAREKGAIFECLAPLGTAVVNVDDDEALAQLDRSRGSLRVGFGTSARADVRLTHREANGTHGARVTLERRGESFDVHLPAVGAAVALNLAAAVAIADATVGQRISSDVIAASVRTWRPVIGRAETYELEGDVLVLDDSYNANPASMRAALATLAELGRSRAGRTIAVLGEMRELGEIAEAEHLALGEDLVRLKTDLVVGCGGMIDATLARAEVGGVEVRRADGVEQAGALVASTVRAGDVVLFKGSRGAAVEQALATLLAKFPRRPPPGADAP